MSETLQTIIVLILVTACVIVVLRGIWRTIGQRPGGIGSCCSKGCGPKQVDSQASVRQTVVFVPKENLKITRKVT